ncbi:glycoside hydrolase family 25 protein [Streptococcus sp. DD13]|uniref:glycoside hydrolase family 25 protein n=1 Tax=Streptococcus sp. DD13 TaxID=1777881 RepID=UPI0007977CF5|nr:glycoside hydrolase family 25 protein [Streptococcus sp. DD13]KXT78581.1 Phage lysin, glycosyl hydrolase, family 25 [Streptococcus sp. DD13]
MRKKIKPIFVYLFFAVLMIFFIMNYGVVETINEIGKSDPPRSTASQNATTASSTTQLVHIDNALTMKPIIDLSGWQLPQDIDYDTLSQNISGVILRVQSGSSTKKDNTASDANGLDKAFETHIKEFQARGIPVAVYAYATGTSDESMRQEAQSFYKAASPYHPTFYWIDVEEKTMSDMNAGVEAFRSELSSLGAKKIGIYIGTYFMNEHSINTDKFDSVWIPIYGSNNGYFDAAPNTDIDYDLHQYTSEGHLNGFANSLDLNILTTLKDPNEVYKKLFGGSAN